MPGTGPALLAQFLRLAGGWPAVGLPESFLSPDRPDPAPQAGATPMSSSTRGTTREVLGSLALSSSGVQRAATTR